VFVENGGEAVEFSCSLTMELRRFCGPMFEPGLKANTKT
jgi:hypothetical protein